MNSQSYFRYCYEFTIKLLIQLWIHYLFHPSTVSFLCFCKFTMNLIMNSLSIFRFDYEFIIYFAIWLWIHFCLRMFYRFFFRSWNNYELTIYFAIPLWINCLFNEIIMNSLSFSQIHFEFTMFLANSPWIHHLFANSLWAQSFFRDLTTNSSSFRKLTLNSRFSLNSLSFSRIHNEFIMFFRLNYDAPSISLFAYESTINFDLIWLSTHYLFALLLWIHLV